MTIGRQLIQMKKRTSWSWERMCRELHRVMGEEGPSHTTLFRYAARKVRRPNVLTQKYVEEGLARLRQEAR